MLSTKKVACIIPARLKSTRFPRKILAPLQGKPLIQWVWEAAIKISLFDEIALAIDSEETASVVKSFGGRYYMTSPDCPSGTDRLATLLAEGRIKADLWVNWQGDEPFITERMILELLQTATTETSDLWTLKKKIHNPDDINNPHIAKVVCDEKGFALYFSRSPIPYYRDPVKEKIYYKHVGLYAYTPSALKKIKSMNVNNLEEAEQLEQLRFLANGLKIRVHETETEVFGIDLPEHLAKAEIRCSSLL